MSDAVAAPGSTPDQSSSSDGQLLDERRLWLWVLIVGATIWLGTAVVTGLTDIEHLIPNVVLLGSFLVPIALVLFALALRGDGYLRATHVILAFLGGGTLGTVFAGVTEVYFLPSAVGTFVGVGLFEETAKVLVVVLVGTRLAERRGRDGMILGATVGAGFAAFESAGYALSTFVEHHNDHPVMNIVSTEAQRAILAPFGHLTWSALIGGAIFAAWRSDGFGPIAPVAWTFAGVVALHAAWDASWGASIVIAQGLVDGDWDAGWPNTDEWIGAPTGAELTAFNLTYDLLIGINALIGTIWIVRRWRSYRAEGAERVRVAAMEASAT
jgi:RsiW-degrading membrane proteinase PrsW (M82 family)